MSYEPIMIDNFVEGYRTREEPWRLPKDAWFQLENGYTYRGNTTKRMGYRQFATGGKGEAPFCESRIVVHVEEETLEQGDGTNTYNLNLNRPVRSPVVDSAGAVVIGDGTMGPYSFFIAPKVVNTPGVSRPIIPGSVTIEDTVGAQVVTDDGAGNLTGDGAGTINYDTGSTSLTFTNNVGGGDPIVATATFETLPIRRGTVTITAGGQTVTDNGLGALSGDGAGTIDYTSGAVVIAFAAPVAAPPPVVEILGTYDYHPDEPVMAIMNYYDVNGNEELVVVSTRTFNSYNESTNQLEYEPLPAGFNFAGGDSLTGGNKDFFHWTNYPDPSTEAPRLLFCNGVDPILVWDGSAITAYAPTLPAGVSKISAKRLNLYYDRLILVRCLQDGTENVRLIYVSGTGTNGDDFTVTDNGAGRYFVKTNTPLITAEISRNDLMVVSQRGNHIFKYTNNDSVPFLIQQFSTNRGADAKMGIINYVTRTFYVSRRGLMETDGYDAVRIDEKIPDYIEDNIDQDDFDDIFFGTTDDERQLWMLHRGPSANEHNRVLVYNYDEGSFAVYTLPFTCTGISQYYFGVTWDDLTAENGYPTWEAFGNQFATWDDVGGDAKKVITLAGGYHGQVWVVFEGSVTDNDVRIRGISNADQAVITTDYQNFELNDVVYIVGVEGMTDMNGIIATVVEVTDNNTITLNVNSSEFSAYDSGGIITKVPQSNYLTPKFNPFIGVNKKARYGYVYFYIDVVEDSSIVLKDNFGNEIRPYIDVQVILGDQSTETDGIGDAPYRVFMDETESQQGSKKWFKLYVDSVGSFIQLQINHSMPTPFNLNAYSISFKEAGDVFV